MPLAILNGMKMKNTTARPLPLEFLNSAADLTRPGVYAVRFDNPNTGYRSTATVAVMPALVDGGLVYTLSVKGPGLFDETGRAGWFAVTPSLAVDVENLSPGFADLATAYRALDLFLSGDCA